MENETIGQMMDVARQLAKETGETIYNVCNQLGESWLFNHIMEENRANFHAYTGARY